MKKALSFILALTLAFSLLPTFAFAVDMEKAELTPEDFNLSFKRTDVNYTGSESFTNQTKFNADNYNTVGSKSTQTTWSLGSPDEGSTILDYTGKTGKVQFLGYGVRLTATSTMIGRNATLVIKFNVENAGYYDVSFIPYGLIDGGTGKVSIDSETACSKNFYSSEDGALSSESLYAGIYLSAGEHKITLESVSAGTGDGYYVAVQSFTFAPSEPTANQGNPKVSFVQTTNVDGYNSVTVKSVTRGASVDLTAHAYEITGYEFVGWKRGSNDADSAWVDIDGDTYDVWTNTFLTAIYKPVGEEATTTVDFWNQNGAYLGTADETSFATDVKRVPSLTGFGTFQGWFTDGNVQLTENTVLSAGTTNAVAQYEDGAVSGVTLNGDVVTEANVYNKAIPLSASIDGFTCWKRDGKVISYDADYIYNVWDATAITEDDDVIADKTPVAILEKNTDYNAYMFEYDDGDYTIVEAGIIFGDGEHTVDSCTKKYTSQRKVSHNQFTVPAESGTAKGYIIWKNNSGVYNIEYFSIAE